MDEAFIAEISSNIVKDFVKDIVSGSYAGLDSLLKKISLNFRREFPEYEKKRCRELSSIPSLYKLGGYIQVTQNFCEMLIERDGGELFNQDFLFNQCLNGGSFAVEAQAGYGKSFLLRWLYLNICHSNVRKIPIFIELRDINNLPYIDIYDYLANEVSVNDKVEVETIKYGLKKGVFVLFFDAFDEIRNVNREKFLLDLAELRVRYPQTSIVISGRQNDYFPAWGGMELFRIKPMSLDRVRFFIAHAEGNSKNRELFLDRLTDDFYLKYESFLSSPLMALLMLMTYSYSSSQMPRSLNEFYQRAYDALCIQLDSVKTLSSGRSYRRIWESGLTYHQFSTIFSFFSAISYVNGKVRFTDSEFNMMMTDAIYRANVISDQDETKIKLVTEDFFEAICLFLKEGLEYVYSHRSFQEYFAAKYFCESTGSKLKRFLNSKRFRVNDNVLPIMIEMNRPKIIHDWAIEAVNELLNIDIHGLSSAESMLITGWNALVFGIDDDKDEFVHFEANSIGRKLIILARFFPDHFADFDREGRSMTRRKFVEVERHLFAKEMFQSDERFQLAADAFENVPKDDQAFLIRRISITAADIEWIRALGFNTSSENDYKALQRIKKTIEKEHLSHERMDELFED